MVLGCKPCKVQRMARLNVEPYEFTILNTNVGLGTLTPSPELSSFKVPGYGHISEHTRHFDAKLTRALAALPIKFRPVPCA